MARTLAQSLASRRNGALSKGPVTPAGKQRSSLNALQHGLSGQGLLFPGESPERLAHHQAQMEAELAPSNYLEQFLVQRITAASWKLLRADALEAGLVRDQLAQTPAGTDAVVTVARAWANSRAPLATYYENRHQRNFDRNLKTLLELPLRRGHRHQVIDIEENQPASDGYPQRANEPEPENATPACGDLNQPEDPAA